MAAPEPAPAGIAGFRDSMPYQRGRLTSALIPWQIPTRIGTGWRLAIDTSEVSDACCASEATPPVTAAPLSPPAEFPAQCTLWMPTPAAEPVAAFVQPSGIRLSLTHAVTARIQAAKLHCGPIGRLSPAASQFKPVPAPEPVAAFVQSVAAVTLTSTLRYAGLTAGLTLRVEAKHAPACVEAKHAPACVEAKHAPACVEATPAPACVEAKHAPAAAARWLPLPAPEPVAAFVQTAAATTCEYAPRSLRFSGQLGLIGNCAPNADSRWMPVAAPEPVATFVQSAAALALTHQPRLPNFECELEPTPLPDSAFEPPPVCERYMQPAAPELVAAFVQASSVHTPAYSLRFPRLAAELAPTPVLERAAFQAMPAPEPVEAFVYPAAALTQALAPATVSAPPVFVGLAPAAIQDSSPTASDRWIPATAAGVDSIAATCHAPGPVASPAGITPQLPVPQFTADLEPFPQPDELLDPPAMHQQWIASPAPEPVARYIQASAAPALAPAITVEAGGFAFSLAGPYIPRVSCSRPALPAEPVMATVIPVTAKPPLVLIRNTPALSLPAGPQLRNEPFQAAGIVAAGPAPEVVESMLVAARNTVPLSIASARYSIKGLQAPPAGFLAAPAMAGALEGPAPVALEFFLVPSMAAPLAASFTPRILPFAVAASQDTAIPSFRAQDLAPAVHLSKSAVHALESPEPISSLAEIVPGLPRVSPELSLPHPGMLPLEYHPVRLRGTAADRPMWVAPRFGLLPPQFALRPVFEKIEEPAQPKPKRLEPELLNMPSAKRQPTVFMVFGRIAAAFLLASALWYGVANFRGDRGMVAREDISPGGATVSADAAPGTNAGNAATSAPQGAIARMKKAIAERAAIKIAENFRGTENWDGAGNTRPTGWSRNRDGYMTTGALALFRPTLKFSDYRMEFFGQIESKSIGWTVRASDAKNYHAMKLKVVEAGVRPFVALVQYNVVNGLAGRPTETPLSVMVHNNRAMQFTVDVRGNRFVTSIDGEEVDTFVDSTLVAGGVGFFSDAGERARLYWLRVSRNDDWLGHVCAMLSNGTATAELRRPAVPGAPLPGLPEDRDGMTLAAVWIGLPYLGATRKARLLKTWRGEPWKL